jgi:hypothetical protein
LSKGLLNSEKARPVAASLSLFGGGTELGVCGLCLCLRAVLGTELGVCGLCLCLRAVLGTELGVCGLYSLLESGVLFEGLLEQ